MLQQSDRHLKKKQIDEVYSVTVWFYCCLTSFVLTTADLALDLIAYQWD